MTRPVCRCLPSFVCACDRCVDCGAMLTELEAEQGWEEARLNTLDDYPAGFRKCNPCRIEHHVKTRALLEKIQRDISGALKPLRFEINNEETREKIKRVLTETIEEHLGVIREKPFELVIGECDPDTLKMNVTIRGPRELLEKFDLGPLRAVDDYRLRAELPDGTEWTE